MAHQNLTVVLFGNASAVQFGPENILLGRDEPVSGSVDISQIVPVSRIVARRSVSVINLLGLRESDLPQHTVDRFFSELVNKNEIQAFIFVLCQLTDDDKVGLEWLVRTFGKDALSRAMMLFTYKSQEKCDTIVDDLKKNPVLDQLMKKCGGWYHTCSKSMNNQSELGILLEKIDIMVSENGASSYSAEMYNMALKSRDVLHSQDRGYGRQQKVPDINEDPPKELKVTTPGSEASADLPDQCDQYKKLFTRLLGNLDQKITLDDVLQITSQLLQSREPRSDSAATFLQKLMMVNYKAREICVTGKQEDISPSTEEAEEESFSFFLDEIPLSTFNSADSTFRDHPMDVQMTVFHQSDSFLKQTLMTKLSQCQFALPLLVPNPFTREIEFPLWCFRQIKRSWVVSGKSTSRTMPISEAETPMVAFFRYGAISSSKSQLISSLINEKHDTFFHRNSPGSSTERLLVDSMVEIAWYYPSGNADDRFPECVAFCNLHGDAEDNPKQMEILTKMSTVNVALLPDQKSIKNNGILQNLCKSPKPLICLLCNSKEGVTRKKMKFRIGLKKRNQADVSNDLRNSIKKCFLKSPSTFRLENVGEIRGITVDEKDEECQIGKAVAVQMMDMLSTQDLPKMKETHLPCQGTPWHKWSQKNKELHRLQGTDIETRRGEIRADMNKIREEQRKCGITKLMKLFIRTLDSSDESRKRYFLRWLTILLDNSTKDHTSHEDSSVGESKQANASTVFGLEHILREMSQIYESFICLQSAEEDVSSLPELAAQIMLLGYPLELMDGDAAHVPLIWVSAVIDELIKKVGDQRVFVLSILGLQSSGKSTMLNAMFGLQFAVSAGRCTRGAFMQLVRVSKEKKDELKFDYVLVVDTEGLRALELAGKTTTRHDNELATFVVGLGNLTLINIFGENPAEMQDILQIVVQAMLRMKKVRLSPSCMFVHQNVGDISAGEKTMEGRRRLLEKLDEMTRLAAKEEECDAECFSHIIEFDIQSDVRYFAQLYNLYSENVHDLREIILSKVSEKRLMNLSQFKSHFTNVWTALLNENFVFSFKNTLEIAAYRRLENKYCTWTWSLRSAMLATENKLYNRVSNDTSSKVDIKDITDAMEDTKLKVDKSVQSFFDEDQDKEILIQWRERFEVKIKNIYNDLVEGTKRKLYEVVRLKAAREKVDREKTRRRNELYNRSKILALDLKGKEISEDALKENFDGIWSQCVNDLNQDSLSVALISDINIWGDVTKILMEGYELNLISERQNQAAYEQLDTLGNYSEYIISNKREEPGQRDLRSTEDDDDSHGELVEGGVCSPSEEKSRSSGLTSEDNKSLRNLIDGIIKDAEELIRSKPIAEHGYSQNYIPEIITLIKDKVKAHQSQTSTYSLKKEFTLDLCLHVCTFTAERFGELHEQFKEANDIRMYLEKQKPQYFNIFKDLCAGTTLATVFGKLMVDKLEPSILQAAYDKTALDVTEKMKCDVSAFRGNRSNLEKHILTSLALEENFEDYIAYIHKPREYFASFITKEVKKYLLEEKTTDIVLKTLKSNIKSTAKFVMDSVKKVTEEANNRNGDVNTWLQLLSTELKDELQFKEESYPEQKEITDLHFLQDAMNKHLDAVGSKLCANFQQGSDLRLEMFRKKPNETMIEQLCQCCWAQCPFCSAICTNTLEGHTGDHDVRFHRNCGINGWSFTIYNNLGLECCTTAVSDDDLNFYTEGKVLKYKDYREAGGEYAKWNICRDDSEMPYWKWFVCRFQENLEKHYEKQFAGRGQIPPEWRLTTKDKAIKSLREL
ncbi:interferon-induced very large GTPase 1-like [Trichomycterus rosablanca]|uniref:interferon-induced very large GTPase 1-like n=1 Tax=Trichomycterus rosablanca TaxID=2290929 RepID=UPI002F351046